MFHWSIIYLYATITVLITIALYYVPNQEVWSPPMSFFLKKLLIILGPVNFHLNFWISLSMSIKIWMRYQQSLTESTDKVGKNCHLGNIKPFNQWSGDEFPFIKIYSLIFLSNMFLLSESYLPLAAFCNFWCISILLILLNLFIHINFC